MDDLMKSYVSRVSRNRAQILDDFSKAYLAHISDKDITPADVQLEEYYDQPNNKYVWRFELKDEVEKAVIRCGDDDDE